MQVIRQATKENQARIAEEFNQKLIDIYFIINDTKSKTAIIGKILYEQS